MTDPARERTNRDMLPETVREDAGDLTVTGDDEELPIAPAATGFDQAGLADTRDDQGESAGRWADRET